MTSESNFNINYSNQKLIDMFSDLETFGTRGHTNIVLKNENGHLIPKQHLEN